MEKKKNGLMFLIAVIAACFALAILIIIGNGIVKAAKQRSVNIAIGLST